MGSPPRTTERTLALSDGVFAIALTVLVFSIHLPHLAAGHEHELAHALLDHRDELRAAPRAGRVVELEACATDVFEALRASRATIIEAERR